MAKYLANSLSAYGFGQSAEEAVSNFAVHAQHNDEPIEMTLVQYDSAAEAEAFPGGYRIEGGEVHSETTFELTRTELCEIADLAGDLELLVDSTLAEAPEVDS